MVDKSGACLLPGIRYCGDMRKSIFLKSMVILVGVELDGGMGLDRWGNPGAAVGNPLFITRPAPAHGHPCHHPSGTEGPEGRWWRRPTDHVPEGEMLEGRPHVVTAYPRIRSRGQTCAV